MTKITDKEDPLVHIQGHIDTAATRAARASNLVADLIAGDPDRTIEGVTFALDSVKSHVDWAIRHIRQCKL